MKVRFNRWYNAVLSVLLAMVGYGCSSDDENIIVSYAPGPDYDYNVYGTIMDEDSIPVQGIKTTLKNIHPDYLDRAVTVDSTLTDSVGEYQMFRSWLPDHAKLIVEDIDGEANGGEFQSDTIDIYERLWNKDIKTINNERQVEINITLKKKQE
ncbi:MAG: radical SAM-associated putative lipoprotein [Prevotella sp.]|nr:radical SAM-associated putative lipoprotein [Prevotella sp.]